MRVVDFKAGRQIVGNNDAAELRLRSVTFSTTTSRVFCLTELGSTSSPSSV